MKLDHNRRLYDIATRMQMYVEGVKLSQAMEFNSVLAELDDEFKKLLHRVKYKTLDGLTKAELNELVLTLRESQSKIYSRYTEKLLFQLKNFMSADLEVSRRAYVSAFIEIKTEEEQTKIPSEKDSIFILEQESKDGTLIPLFGLAAIVGNDEKLWSTIKNQPIPANGAYLLPFVKGFSVSAQASIENIIRKAYANKWTIEETIAEISGTGSRQGTTGQLQRVQAQAGAVIATAVQHVGAIVGAAVMSALFAEYQWDSVMDGKTSDICRGRNGKRYKYGQGPLPPAHIRCRSIIRSIVGRGDIEPEGLYTWFVLQPKNVQDDLFTAEVAEAIRSGKIKPSDLGKFESRTALSLKQFRAKIAQILSRSEV